jgi:hypothetical protein
MAQAGYICGLIGTVILALGLFVLIAMIVVILAI